MIGCQKGLSYWESLGQHGMTQNVNGDSVPSSCAEVMLFLEEK